MGNITKLYQVDVGVDDKGKYIAQILVLSDKRGIAYQEPSMKNLFVRIKRALLQKDKQMRAFPLPRESAILGPMGQKLLTTPTKT